MELTPMDYQETLRRLTLDDERYIADVLGRYRTPTALKGLEPKFEALARIGAMIAIDAGPGAIETAVATARATGASQQEIVDVLLAVGSVVGSARLVSAAPRIGRGLGFDVDAALEQLDVVSDASRDPA